MKYVAHILRWSECQLFVGQKIYHVKTPVVNDPNFSFYQVGLINYLTTARDNKLSIPKTIAAYYHSLYSTPSSVWRILEEDMKVIERIDAFKFISLYLSCVKRELKEYKQKHKR